jgi:C4-dicarboxylate-specific signal transduction histidine kinase
MTPERLRLFCQVFGNALWRHVNMVEMQQMQDELTRLDRVSRLAQLTAMLAHELNQPLAAMLCNAQAAVRLLEQTPPDVDETRLALDDIVDNARRAGAVVQRTRALFKGARQSARPVSMHALVDSVCTLLHNEIVLADISVCQSVEAALPQVLGDEVQLQQVLRNLLANAIDAVRGKPKDERRIAVSAEVDASAKLFLLRVQDSGVGFPPGQEEELFKPFHTTKEDGMGMGLAICRQIVESFGGTIQAERVPAGGTLFRVALPLAQDSALE